MHRSPRFALVAVVAVASLAGCRGGRPAEPMPAPDPDGMTPQADAGPTVGGPGTVCSLGRMSQGSAREAHECNPGLSCCYPCGVEGCDSVCMDDCGPPRP